MLNHLWSRSNVAGDNTCNSCQLWKSALINHTGVPAVSTPNGAIGSGKTGTAEVSHPRFREFCYLIEAHGDKLLYSRNNLWKFVFVRFCLRKEVMSVERILVTDPKFAIHGMH